MYKLISLDLDGTTLNEHSKVTQETKKAIRYAKSKGVKVVVNTGRIYAICHDIARELEATEDLLCSVGTICFHDFTAADGGSIMFRHSFDYELARDIMRCLTAQPIFTTAFSCRDIYTDEKSVAMGNWTRNKLFPGDHIYPDLIAGLEKNGIFEMEKFSAVAEYEVLLETEAIIKREFPQVTTAWSSPKMFEIVPEGIDKGTGLRDLAAHYGIERREIIACGDSNNDFAMLKYAGLPVAVANADAETKAICRYITKSNTENGIAHMIYELI